MPGLNLGVMGGVRANTSNSGGGFSSQVAPTTATEAGFGPGYSVAGSPSTANIVSPNDPFGVALWGGIGALVLLLLIRHSLPNS